jgi:hypothetical protein
MQHITRYAVQLENGSFIRSDFAYRNGVEIVTTMPVGIAVDGDLHPTRKEADRFIRETLDGSSMLPVLYDDDNLPTKVVKVEIDFGYGDDK